MSDDSSDEEFVSVFACRADNIMKKQREAYEEMLKKVAEEDTAKAEKDEENELLEKIHEKLKKKPRANRKTRDKVCPPKPVEESLPPRRSNRRRKTSPEKDKEDVVSKMDKQSPINLPARAKKKLLKIDLENKREKKRIETLNKRVLSYNPSFDDEDITIEVEEDKNITLKISYLSDIFKVTVCENEKFSSVISKVADLFKLKVTEVTLCLRDEIISLDGTPASLKVKSWDIIDCIPYKPSDEMQDDTNNKICIKMQSSDSRKKVDIYAHKLEKFQDIMEKYANLRNLPLKDLIFEFDGERISGSDTPEDLDMENESCVDVKVIGDSLKPPPPSIPFVDLDREDFSHEMLDICVLD